MHQLNQILQVATATILALTSLALITSLRQGKHLWAAIGFSLCVLSYLVIETSLVQESLLRVVVLTGSASVPLFFWLLSKSIFEDQFKFTPSLIAWFLLLIGTHVPHYACDVEFPMVLVISFEMADHLISFVLLFMAIYVALKTRQTDLVETRLRFRSKYIFTTALLIAITLVVEAAPESVTLQYKDPLQVAQRLTILGLTVYFLLSNFGFQSGFFFKEIPRPKPVFQHDTALEQQLMALLTDKNVYRSEGLTIKELANVMNVQEHRLRKLINMQLGFKNFNDFLNQYRVSEACEILSDPSQNQKTILEIAYALGYQSIGPFNKAFKELKSTTPTTFRKERQQ
jgi:AraC-like DNA-binding protein